jgi:hypothetical protein
MRTLSKLGLSIVALALAVGIAPKSFAAETGSIAVTVNGADGKPAGNVTVKLMKGGAPKRDGAKKPAAQADAPKAVLAADAAPKKPGAGKGPQALKEATTDAQGVAKFADVEVGEYRVAAMNEGGRGMAPVKVEAGKEATATITLKAAQPKPAK